MSSGMQPVYQLLNPLYYGWQLTVFMFQYGIIVYNSPLRKKKEFITKQTTKIQLVITFKMTKEIAMIIL